jgi:c-Rel proto-oncogene protein
VKIQLRRPSDNATSDPLDFEMLPLNEGRRGFWNIQRELKKRSADTDLFQQLLDVDNEEEKFKVESLNSVNSLPLQSNHVVEEVVVLDTPVEIWKPIVCEEKTMNYGWRYDENDNDNNNNIENNQNIINHSEDDKTLNDLLEQVAELDVIYQDHQLRKENMALESELHQLDQNLPREDEQQMEMEFDDAATYSSLQKAFKHPIVFADAPPIPPKPGHPFDNTCFELVLPPIVINPATPDIFYRNGDEKLPPLPPKRAKKLSESGDKENKIENVDDNLNGLVRHNSTRSLTPRPQSQPIVIKSADLRRSPSHKLPPKPVKNNVSNTSTLPKQKKPGFFSKIFSRRKSKPDLDSSVTEDSIKAEVETFESEENSCNSFAENQFVTTDPIRGSLHSTRSLKSPPAKKQKVSKPVGRSVSSASGKRPHLTPDVIHIPLKGDSSNSLPLHASSSATHLSLPGNDVYERASTASLHPIDRKTMSALQLADVPIQDGDMELVAIADAQSLRNLCESGEHGIILDPSVDLTEAEHYALYTTLAPHATESEFDESSCYYQPVEAGQILSPAEVSRRLNEGF